MHFLTICIVINVMQRSLFNICLWAQGFLKLPTALCDVQAYIKQGMPFAG